MRQCLSTLMHRMHEQATRTWPRSRQPPRPSGVYPGRAWLRRFPTTRGLRGGCCAPKQGGAHSKVPHGHTHKGSFRAAAVRPPQHDTSSNHRPNGGIRCRPGDCTALPAAAGGRVSSRPRGKMAAATRELLVLLVGAGLLPTATAQVTGDPCSGDIATLVDGGEIDYPSGNGNYANDQVCRWGLSCSKSLRR
jgi:hypothetical protein